MTGVMSNVVPIILLILLGYIIRIKGLLKEETMIGIKKLVLDISLPAILFSTFLNMHFEKGYFSVIFISFAMLFTFSSDLIFNKQVQALIPSHEPIYIMSILLWITWYPSIWNSFWYGEPKKNINTRGR